MRTLIALFILLTIASCTKKGIPVEIDDSITLEKIWKKGMFWSNSYSHQWMNDSKFFSRKSPGLITKHDVFTGDVLDTLFNGFNFGDDLGPFQFSSYGLNKTEDKILLAVEPQRIYRYSTKEYYYVYDIPNDSLFRVAGGKKAMFAKFSPDGSRLAYVRENNLYYYELKTGREVQITKDGKDNEIINGRTDWVYEEEFAFTRAFFWSPDNSKIAFYRLDESKVPEYNMQVWGRQLYPRDYKFKYPKAGEKNSEVKLLMYDLKKDSTKTLLDETGNDNYIPRVQWVPSSNLLSVRRLNRLQNHLELLHIDTESGKANLVYEEKNDTYVEITDDLKYIKDGKYFILTSEKDGYRHIYSFGVDGNQIKQLTKGKYEVSEIYGYDETSNRIYYSSTENSPLTRQIYGIGLNGKDKVSYYKDGSNTANFSKDFRYYINYNSSINQPPYITLESTKPATPTATTYERNQRLRKFVAEEKLKASFFNFKGPSGDTLNGWYIKPPGLENLKDSKKQYPVLMYVYGGPGHQTVRNTWQSVNFFWFQMLARRGYIVVSVDGRGTGGRGAKFKKCTYAQLGKYETEDQIAAAKYLSELPSVDKNRIGIWGWSYGGYMSSLCITLGADFFKAAIAVAPVTHWKFYDTIYTERYLKRPEDNKDGYDDNSPLNHAHLLRGNYLLVHGTGDDNVHVQNSIAMQNALIKANKQFDSFFYPDRNHGIYGGNTRYHLYKMMTDFILKKL